MKKSLLLILMLGLIAFNSKAQVSYYSFSQANGTFDTLTTGNLLGSATTATGTYFVNPAAPAGSTTIYKGTGFPIGFTFNYNGSNFNVFGVNADGWISFGQDSVNMNSSAVGTPISATSTATAALQNRVSAMGQALVAQPISKIKFATLGSSPNQIFVVEWRNYKRSGGYPAPTDTLTFQVRLYETTNVVECMYGKVKCSTSIGSASPQVGLRGTANTDYNTRTSTNGWTSTTAGTAASTISLSTTYLPAPGLTYIFTPPFQLDAGISAINSPVTSLVSGSTKITASIKSYGLDSIASTTIAWSVNGVLQPSYSWSGSKIGIGKTNGPDSIGTYNFLNPGLYTIKAWTESPNGGTDGNHANDTTSKIVYVKGYATLPFMENFDKIWVTSTDEVPSIYWTNSPNTGNSSWRRDDDGTSAAWTTTTGAYTPAGAGTGSVLHSARFHSASAAAGTPGLFDAYMNFSTVGSKVLKFWHINTSGNDSLSIYVSNDSGTTFNFIQKITTDASWIQHTLNLGSSTSPKSIVRFKGVSATTTNDFGIDSVQVYVLPTNDAGVTTINSPSTSLVAGSTKIAVTIANYGADTLRTANIAWSVNGVSQTPFPWTGKIAFGAIKGPDTIGIYNFTIPGLYTIKTWTVNPNGGSDANHLNDTTSKVVYVVGYASIPFYESFNKTWITPTYEVPSIYWVNTPATGNNSWRRNDEGATASWTNITTGAYTPTGVGSASSLYSARFHSASAATTSPNNIGTLDAYIDFSTVGTKLLKFWHINTSGSDTLSVFLSNDGGTTFNLIQKFATASAWTQHLVTLGTSTAANSIVRFSAKNATGGGQATDIGLDSVQVYMKPANDMAATAWLAPLNGCGRTASDTVTIRIKNVGDAAQSSIPVKYTIDGGATYYSETCTTTINPGDSLNYTFTKHADFSTAKTYSCVGIVNLAQDANLADDTVKAILTTLNTISGNPFIDNLEAGNKYYYLMNSTNSSVALNSAVGNNKTHGFQMTGGASGTWTAGTSTSTTPHSAFAVYTDHVATLNTCNINALAYSANNLFLSLDLKESYYTGPKYTYFMVLVNGIDTLSDITGTRFFNPATATDTMYSTKVFNLSSYIGQPLTLNFMSSCKYSDANAGGKGNNVYLDNIVLSAKPVVNLGTDTTICPNSSIVLNAGSSPFNYLYTYAWSTLLYPATIATTQTIAADSAATYIATVNNGYGVSSSDTIVIKHYQPIVVSLGHDTTNCVSYTLDPGAGYSSYSWSTGVTSQTINVTSTGTYWVDVTGAHGCVARDSANVTIIPMPVSYAGAAQSICYLDTLDMVGSSASFQDSVLWISSGDGHFNDSTLLHPKYIFGTNDISNKSVTLALVSYAKCGTDTSKTVITITTSANANAGKDTAICLGNSVQLLATGGTTYLWRPSAGLSDTTIANPIAHPTATTAYVVKVTSSCGIATDTVVVKVDHITVPNLGKDTALCTGGAILLNAGSGYNSYAWSTGATTQSINYSNTGIGTFPVWIDVTHGACSASDTINIKVDDITVPNLGKDTTFCNNVSVLLNAGAGYDKYLWSTGATTQSISYHNTNGTFPVWVEVTHGACFATDTINLTYTSCVGIAEINSDPFIKIFPNPSTGFANIEVNGFTDGTYISIYSLQGKLEYSDKISGNGTLPIDLTKLSKGIYMVRVYNEKNSILSKLILQ